MIRTFQIQRFCTEDGPGIRTVVFLKGCGLRCRWCHNPESISAGFSAQLLTDKCIGCRSCFEACPQGDMPLLGTIPALAPACGDCRACFEACPAQALELIGKDYTPRQLKEIILRDREFFDSSGGGVTFGGGEPLLQYQQLLPLLEMLKIPVAVETAGFVDWHAFEAVNQYVDLYLFDIKTIDPAAHKAGTGADNKIILENFDSLYRTGAKILVRTPVIPGFNDSAQQQAAIDGFVKGYPDIAGHERLPFNNAAQHKYDSLRMPYDYGDQKTVPIAK